MLDALGRKIDYMRLSVTDRCNMRCRYCMPHGVKPLAHEDILTYEEMLAICREAVALGIDRFKITGGEPLVRKGCVEFVRRLKALRGVRQVTLTTNGLALGDALEELAAIPVNGINVSLDSLNPTVFQRLTGTDAAALATVTEALERCVALNIPTRLNAVLTEDAFSALEDLLLLATRLRIDVRLIELMPMGEGAGMACVSSDRALELCEALFPGLRPAAGPKGNGPARYYEAPGLMGSIGMIDAVSHPFCADCNRVRLTATGMLKPCLCYGAGVELRPLLRRGAAATEIREAVRACIYEKPASHCFSAPERVTEHGAMNRIGG